MTAAVFIADDNPADVDLIQLAFDENGLNPDYIVASDGLQAIELLKTALPALILLDIKMPGADGFEVLSYLRGQPRLRDVHVIVMSSSTAPVDKERALKLGAKQYWPKPARFDDTVQFIGTLRRFVLGTGIAPPEARITTVSPEPHSGSAAPNDR